jgi:hypothetical protein
MLTLFKLPSFRHRYAGHRTKNFTRVNYTVPQYLISIPIFTLNYTQGVKGLLGGEYNYQNVIGNISKRFTCRSWALPM